MKITLKNIFFAGLILYSATVHSRTYHVAITGNDQNEGAAIRPFLTIMKAAELARPGDTILVHEGTYRERIAPPRGGEKRKPITYMAAINEKVIVKGSEIWNPQWKSAEGSNDVCIARLEKSLFGSFNPYLNEISMFELMASSSFYKLARNQQADEANLVAKDIKVKAEYKYTLGQVFVNDKILTEVLSQDEVIRKEGSWTYLKTDSSVCVHFPNGVTPADALVELTTRNRIFAPHLRGLGYIHVEGFIFEHCANDAICLPHMVKDHPELATGQQGAVSTRSGHHWVIKNNVIRYAKTVGLDIGSETSGKTVKDYESITYFTPPKENVGYHLIQNNIISDNGIAGIVGTNFNDTDILNNVVERNNLLLYTGQQHAGIKVLLIKNCKVEGNIVRDNECIGIWFDNQVNNSTIKNNIVLNNMKAGIYFEMGSGPVIIENNIVGYTRKDFVASFAPGIFISDASGVTVKDNQVFNNAGFGLQIRLLPGRKCGFTSSGIAEAKNINVTHNSFYQNAAGMVEMPFWGTLVDRISFDSNTYSGINNFALKAIGERNQSGFKGSVQNQKIKTSRGNQIDKEPITLKEKDGLLFRSVSLLTFSEWQELMPESRNSSFIPY